MRLYSASLTLFGKKIEIALAEKGLAYERVLVPFNQAVGYSPKHPDVLAANPKGQVPVLIDSDLTLYDSTVILEYLEDAYPLPPLFPHGATARAQCRLLEFYGDEVIVTPLRALMHRNSPRPPDASRWTALEAAAAGAEATLAARWAELDAKLEGTEFFCGAFSAADLAIFLPLHYALRLGGVDLRHYPRLLRWYRAVAARPAFARAVKEIAAADQALSEPVDGAFKGLK
jgi:glutathione S-transferase